MRLNEKAVANFAGSGAPPDKEGYLHKRGDFNRGYQKRWFVLKGNLLFYFEKRIEKEPTGMIVMEGCTVELSDLEDGFTFMIHFPGTHSRTYVMCADTQEDMEAWMKVLSVASYDYIKMCVAELQGQLQDLASSSTKSLIQSVLEDSGNFSRAAGSHSSSHKTNTPAFPATSTRRYNPFDSDDSVDRDSCDSQTERQCRTFVEMHKEFGAQIKEILADWLQRKSHNSTLRQEFTV